MPSAKSENEATIANIRSEQFVGEIKNVLDELILIRFEALVHGWEPGSSMAAWYHDRLDELEILRNELAELRSFAENRGWSGDDDETAAQFIEDTLVIWKAAIEEFEKTLPSLKARLVLIDVLAKRHGWQSDHHTWAQKPAIEYLEALLGDLDDQYSGDLRDGAPTKRSCKNCHKELYCGTRKDAWKLTGDSGHIDNDDLLFSALADSCTVYSRKVDQ